MRCGSLRSQIYVSCVNKEDFLRIRAAWRDGVQLPKPIPVQKSLGSKRYDLLMGGGPDFLLISSRMRDTLLENGLTGWTTFPLLPVSRDRELLGGYSGLLVHGRSGPADLSRARRVKIIEPLAIPSRRVQWEKVGWYIDAASWDGSDLFHPGIGSTVMLSERASEVLASRVLTNVDIIPISEMRVL